MDAEERIEEKRRQLVARYVGPSGEQAWDRESLEDLIELVLQTGVALGRSIEAGGEVPLEKRLANAHAAGARYENLLCEAAMDLVPNAGTELGVIEREEAKKAIRARRNP